MASSHSKTFRFDTFDALIWLVSFVLTLVHRALFSFTCNAHTANVVKLLVKGDLSHFPFSVISCKAK
jgi:hypothetical protein